MMDPSIHDNQPTEQKPPTGEAQPRVEAKEAFMAAADRIITAAKSEVQKRFEQSRNADGNLEYHRLKHTEADIRRTDTILEAIGADERMRKLGEIASAHHDIVQNWKELKGGRRLRAAGMNEKESANEAENVMLQQNKEAGEEIFTEKDVKIVREAILATVPSYEGGSVIQPNLTPESHPVAAAMALSDLGEAGMDGPDVYILGSNANFREDNMGIGRARETGKPIPEENKESFRQRMVNWSEGQIGFAASREELFETDIAPFTEEGKGAVRRLFPYFEETIAYMRKITFGGIENRKARNKMTFEELAVDMGY